MHCDRCPIRIDIGPNAIVQNHLRMPSSWLEDGPDHHLCPSCAGKELDEMREPSPA